MRLPPKSEDGRYNVPKLKQPKCEDGELLTDSMPKLFPEMSSLETCVKSEKPLAAAEVKEEEEDGEKPLQINNPFCLRLKNLNNFPSSHGSALRPTYRSQGMAIHRAKYVLLIDVAGFIIPDLLLPQLFISISSSEML